LFGSQLSLVAAGLLLLSFSGNVLLPFEPTITVRGVMASKGDFFDDVEVQRLLLKHHIRVDVTRRGSREILRENLDDYDFAFPSGQPVASLIENERAARNAHSKTTELFTSPMVLATYREYAETLTSKGIAIRQGAGDTSLYYTLETKKFLETVEAGKTWNDLGTAEFGVTNGNRVLAKNPGVCRANSAGTYLSLVAFVHGDGKIPQSEAEAAQLAERIRPLIEAQGMPESDLFPSYLTLEGKGAGPIVVVYEHQYLAYQIGYQARTGQPDRERVLLYPRQESQTDPKFIATNAAGDRLADVLTTDVELRQRAMELGFRILDDSGRWGSEQLFQFLQQHHVPPPPRPTEVTTVQVPKLPLLEKMIIAVGECAA
jgi:hypothetical protein